MSRDRPRRMGPGRSRDAHGQRAVLDVLGASPLGVTLVRIPAWPRVLHSVQRRPRDHPARARVAGVAGVRPTSPFRRSAGLGVGHTWVRVRVDGDVRDVCARSLANSAGHVHFEPVGRVRKLNRTTRVLTTTGSSAQPWPPASQDFTVGHVLSGSSTRVIRPDQPGETPRRHSAGERDLGPILGYQRPQDSATCSIRRVRRRLVGGRDELLGHLPQLHVTVGRQSFEEREGVLVIQFIALHDDADCLPDDGPGPDRLLEIVDVARIRDCLSGLMSEQSTQSPPSSNAPMLLEYRFRAPLDFGVSNRRTPICAGPQRHSRRPVPRKPVVDSQVSGHDLVLCVAAS